MGDVAATGLSNGAANGMALHGDVLVVTYGDGSIESFNTSAGVPVSNNDEQYATGHPHGLNPVGVDISKNGRYAIFGDYSGAPTAVEVSDISSGKLTAPSLYDSGNLGAGTGSTDVLLSPSDNLLYIMDSLSNQVTAARFSDESGRISPGCVSAALIGEQSGTVSVLALKSASGTGGVVYAAGFGYAPYASSVTMLVVSSTGTQCMLTEPTNSPVSDPDAYHLQSIAVWPPRAF